MVRFMTGYCRLRVSGIDRVQGWRYTELRVTGTNDKLAFVCGLYTAVET